MLKDYFKQIYDLIVKAIADIDRLNAENARAEETDKAQLSDGVITDKGLRENANARALKLQQLKADITRQAQTIRDEYNKAVDAYFLPKSEEYNEGDAKMLEVFTFSDTEFMQLVEKYTGNPTMERLLDAYRAENKIATQWRAQTPESLKYLFYEIMFAFDSWIELHSTDRAYKSISKKYHSIHGADADFMPTEDESGADNNTEENAETNPGEDATQKAIKDADAAVIENSMSHKFPRVF